MAISNRVALLLALLSAPAAGEATIDYVFTIESTPIGKPRVLGQSRATTIVDGASFRILSQQGRSIERSDDDGRTTYFASDPTTPHAPLVHETANLFAPIVGTLEDETITIGPPVAGPAMFGLPTRTYTVEHTYTIAARVAYVFRRTFTSHAHFTITVADAGLSAAALRVAWSRGYGYALAQHAEAFTGLPLRIDGMIESAAGSTHVQVEAETFTDAAR